MSGSALVVAVKAELKLVKKRNMIIARVLEGIILFNADLKVRFPENQYYVNDSFIKVM